MLINLLGNAIEHPRSDCHIVVKVERKQGAIEFSVADDGGIEADVLDHLLERRAVTVDGKEAHLALVRSIY
ncbi:MAG TPA: ATP-binding protein [Rectinemataceae bacterium]|nr:ATP-binding protein [Rectinemataceae bacterium]